MTRPNQLNVKDDKEWTPICPLTPVDVQDSYPPVYRYTSGSSTNVPSLDRQWRESAAYGLPYVTWLRAVALTRNDTLSQETGQTFN